MRAVWLGLLALAGGCAKQVTLDRQFSKAVEDAEVAEEQEVYDELIAISPQTPALRWDEQDRVLVVTWTAWDGYDGSVGQAVPVGVDVWVTAVPELQAFCSNQIKPAKRRVLRLEQVLGIPANNGKDRFVQLWVSPEDLFRPSPDPEVDDTVAELEFPPNTPQSHIDWITDLRGSSYGEGGYPWTRLGYTYDWKRGGTVVGLSEFVVTKGSTVGVEGVYPIDTYCDAKGSQ